MADKCENRIPDHTDFVTCGKPTVAGQRQCIECLELEYEALSKEYVQAADHLDSLSAELDSLSAELDAVEKSMKKARAALDIGQGI